MRQAEAETNGLFTAELQVFTDLTKGLAAIKEGHFNSTGAFITTDQKKWLDDLKEYIHEQENPELKQLKYPAGLSEAGKKQYREQVSEQIDALKKTGWSKQSVSAYVEYLNQHPQSEQKEVDRKHLNSIYEQTKTVGTQVFLGMWNAWKTKKNQKEARAKVMIFLNTAKVAADLPQDKDKVRQLLNNFAKTLPPDSSLWRSLANEVQSAFPKKGLHGEFGKRVNNLRYVISAQQAQYVRDNYEGESDEDKLAQYLKDRDYNLKEPDRYHQKKGRNGTGDFPDGYYEGNYKVVVNFNTEFILNSKGQFQNEIDPEGNTPNGVINGASFNYANKNGKTHDRLDANVKNLDPEWRNKMRISNGRYKSPTPKKYRQKSGWYAAKNRKGNRKISRKDKSNELKDKFRKKVEGLKD